ncbi:sensor histidine kinase [Phaeodactylibacter xiamenensis]|uniref:sensor histidine kinase n=1 Tax=Phaeodactylibacter xiamenensis TaxID=1524460 RepID=UPI003BA9EF2F
MENRRNVRLRLLSYVVIAYMMMAFAWWSVLLYTKNSDAFAAKRDKMRLIMVAEGTVQSEEAFLQSAPYLELKQQYTRQEYMILGEAGVIILTLLVGMYLINRAYNKEMEAARQQRNFLLSITHELKSPIASIRLVLETFQRRSLPPEKSERLIRSALLETERLNGLVSDLLLSARLEAAYKPHEEGLDLPQILEDLIETLDSKYPDARFHFEKRSVISPFRGDRTGMTSVMLNLMENAVKYSPKPADIEVSLEETPDALILRFADQGHGIPDKEKPQVFGKFYRIGNEDTRKTKGTGLGLYIVQQIVAAHDGRISVEDNQPKGTVFKIELPAERLDKQAAQRSVEMSKTQSQ